MRIDSRKYYAVLTGDIVKSTTLSLESRKKLTAAWDEIEAELFGWPEVQLPVSRYRGDAWQILVSAPNKSFRIALYIRAALRMRFEESHVDSRVAIGIGHVDFVPGRRVAEGDGPAYRLSGAALERKGWRRLQFASMDSAVRTAGLPEGSDVVQVVFDLVDTIASVWTASQARAMVGAISGLTQEQIAKQWKSGPVTQQAVAQHLARAGWDGIRSALAWYERTIQP